MRGSIRTGNRHLLRSDMITASLRRLLLALVLCTGSIALVRADPPLAEEQFETLRKRFEDAKAKYFAAYSNTKTEEERERITTTYPAHTMVDDFLKLEEAHRGTQVGISALHQLVSQAGTVGSADSPSVKGRQAALKILGEYY